MITKDEARALVETELGRMRKKYLRGGELAILDDRTLEMEFGWVFFYDTKEFLETGENSHRLLGNAPIIVDRNRGTLHVTGTAKPIEEYIHEFERNENVNE